MSFHHHDTMAVGGMIEVVESVSMPILGIGLRFYAVRVLVGLLVLGLAKEASRSTCVYRGSVNPDIAISLTTRMTD
jgi:hypothetical protein